MEKQNRIPEKPGKSHEAMKNWFAGLYAADLLFHPDDRPEDIVSIATGEPTFTLAECNTLKESLATLFEHHGDEVYVVALDFFHKAMGIEPTYSIA
jgi:hypothetical protein